MEKGSKNLGKTFGVTPHTVLANINQSAFSEINQDSAYWIGFLMADGCIINNIVSLGLSIADISHVIKFKTFMGSKHKINEYKSKTDGREAIKLSIHSDKIVSDLSRFGVIKGKTKRATVKQLEFNPHFWRGVIDGDGSVVRVKDKYPNISLVGSDELCGQFLNFVKTVYHGSIKTIVHNHENIYRIRFSGKVAKAVINTLYGDPNVTALDRKMETAQEILHQE